MYSQMGNSCRPIWQWGANADKGSGRGSLIGMEMPVNYVIEMFCDRVAAIKMKFGMRTPSIKKSIKARTTG